MVQFVLRDRSVRIQQAQCERLVRRILKAEAAKLDLTVILVGDRESRAWNRRCLRHDWSTDVVAQAYAASEGEVVVNVARAQREARRRGHSAAAEVLFYVAHGVLHLLGYDDATPQQRAQMLALQSQHLASLGLVVR